MMEPLGTTVAGEDLEPIAVADRMVGHIRAVIAQFGDSIKRIDAVTGRCLPMYDHVNGLQYAGLWCPDPGDAIWVLAQQKLMGAVAHLDALARLIPPGHTINISGSIRPTLEASATAWWLTDPGVTTHERVSRVWLLRRQQIRSAARLPPARPYRGDIEAEAAAVSEARRLHGFTTERKQMSRDERVNALMGAVFQDPDQPATYYSGISSMTHAELPMVSAVLHIEGGLISSYDMVQHTARALASFCLAWSRFIYGYALNPDADKEVCEAILEDLKDLNAKLEPPKEGTSFVVST